MQKGYIHIYTGNGKGKTTAAIGLAIRAKSRGLRVLFVQFMKGGAEAGEISFLKKLSISTKKFSKILSPYFHPEADRAILKKEVANAMMSIKKIMQEERFDLIILDEFTHLIFEGLLAEKDAVDFVLNKPEAIEVVITGRGATENLIAAADYVTDMKMIKHPITSGIKARKGIEF